MQHGGGQDQSDWMNMGDVPVIMDNLIQDGTTEPAVVITTNTNYLGAANQGYPNLRNVVIPFVEANYNVSTARDRPRLRGSVGGFFGHAEPHPLRRHEVRVLRSLEWRRLGARHNGEPGQAVHPVRRRCDGTSVCPTRPRWPHWTNVAFVEKVVVAGAHDFNTWNQLFTTFARDYLWHPEAFILDEIDTSQGGVAATSLNKGNKNALTVKLDQAYKLVAKGRERRRGRGAERVRRPGQRVPERREAD